MKHTLLLYIILTAVFFTSCKQNRFKIDTDKSDLQIKIERFDKDVFALDTNNIIKGIPALQEKYGDFFRLYTEDLMQFGSPSDTAWFQYAFCTFLTDSVFRNAYETSLHTFNDVSGIEKKLTKAFRYIEYYFPKTILPKIYMHVSGFNQPVVATDSILSISTDNYLGRDFASYKNLVHSYQLEGMKPENVPSDYVMVWLVNSFPFSSETLLDNMLYQGKIMFLLETFMPGEKEHILMAFTPEQLKWCRNNEKKMWITMVESKHLFMQDRMLLAKYLGDAPSTSYFPPESPGRAAVWIGWQIIRAYMANNQDITLQQLMSENNYRKILEKSGYRP